jgi:hypothetical protein
MHKVLTAAIVAFLSISPAFAGALVLQVDNPRSSPEAAAKNAVVLARVTECMSPEKTVVAATAEGVVRGVRQTIPLNLIRLATPGLYAVARDWSNEGTWAVRIVVRNPDYGTYVTSAIVPVAGPFHAEAVTKLFRVPTEEDIATVLAKNRPGTE